MGRADRLRDWLLPYKAAIIVGAAFVGALLRFLGGATLAGAIGEFVALLVIVTIYLAIAHLLYLATRSVADRLRGEQAAEAG